MLHDRTASKSRHRRILLGLAIVVVLCGIYIWYFGVATMCALEARWVARNAPIVKKTPQPLADLSISEAPGRTLSFAGYQFDIPRDDLDDSKTKLFANGALLSFQSGLKLRFATSPPRAFVDCVLSAGQRDSWRQMYGDAALQSDYAFKSLLLQTTPDQITPLTPRKEAVGRAMLVVMKGVAVSSAADSGIFSVQAGDFKGFQYGDPNSRPKQITVDLFTDSGGGEFIFFLSHKGQLVSISQAEINRVLGTVHPLANDKPQAVTLASAQGSAQPASPCR